MIFLFYQAIWKKKKNVFISIAGLCTSSFLPWHVTVWIRLVLLPGGKCADETKAPPCTGSASERVKDSAPPGPVRTRHTCNTHFGHSLLYNTPLKTASSRCYVINTFNLIFFKSFFCSLFYQIKSAETSFSFTTHVYNHITFDMVLYICALACKCSCWVLISNPCTSPADICALRKTNHHSTHADTVDAVCLPFIL